MEVLSKLTGLGFSDGGAGKLANKSVNKSTSEVAINYKNSMLTLFFRYKS